MAAVRKWLRVNVNTNRSLYLWRAAISKCAAAQTRLGNLPTLTMKHRWCDAERPALPSTCDFMHASFKWALSKTIEEGRRECAIAYRGRWGVGPITVCIGDFND
jgi:hypothetical protein